MDSTASNHREYRRIGPPGTGKTTWIVRQAKRAIDAWCARTGGEPRDCHDVLIATLTTGAAAELRSRGVDLPKEQIGTLHSHAFRALDNPKMCVGAREMAKWNEECGNPAFRMSAEGGGDKSDDKDLEGAKNGGDHWRQLYHLHQSQLRPRELWAGKVREFADVYERWKRINDLLDFSDLVHQAYLECETAPGEPSIIFVDEAQDHDAAEFRLVRRWAEQADTLIIVGDPDQAIYEFRGGDPKAFYATEIPEENTQVLTQSYRVPRAVHAEAMGMISRCNDRKEVEYQPRDYDGAVIKKEFPMQGNGAEEVRKEISKHLAEGKTVMALASCHYMLRGLMKELKFKGIPYWNPFSKTNSVFNPLHPANGVGGKHRLMSYLVPSAEVHGDKARLWTAQELYDWTSVCRSSGLLRHGAKTAIKKLAQQTEAVLSYEAIADLFESPEVLEKLAATGISTGWLVQHLHPTTGASTRYAVRVVDNHGIDALTEDPKLVIGTIHSVKGGESDVVIVSPECSPKEMEQLQRKTQRNAVYRKFYVAMTRARETLVLLCPKRGGVEW